ncbi:hypothetical protein ACIA5D_43860 [Actinoplanes sp. NPDC051513]|uniref:hypothetical protein n=1 Tax=Actinoplanes sp. NPDC051513 TaxID=3363908 RepID=UPI0037B1223A
MDQLTPHHRRALRLVVATSLVAAMLGTGTSAAADGRQSGPRAPVPVFVLEHGRYHGFDVPFGPYAGELVGINNRGDITGGYAQTADACVHGFLRDVRGRFSRIDFPGAGATQPIDLDDRGTIVGSYQIADCNDTLHGFVRDPRGRFVSLDAPGSVATQAFGINNHGQVVGQYNTGDGGTHGFVWDRGRFMVIDGPAGAIGATILDVNDRGQMVGLYADRAGTLHAFLLIGRDYTVIDVPAAPVTFPFGLNNRGDVALTTATRLVLEPGVGGYALRAGTRTEVAFPKAAVTAALDINDHGTVIGVYNNPAPRTDR